MSTLGAQDLQGKVVLVTGASRGLGRAMAKGLAAAGASVSLTARPGSEARLAEVGRSITARNANAKLLLLHGDIVRPRDCEAMVERTREHFGALHVLVNNAALGMDQLGSHTARQLRFQDVPIELWQRMIDTNINGTFLMSRAAIPHLLYEGWGRIVNLSTSFPRCCAPGCRPTGPPKRRWKR